jgi:PLP dependent protein
VSEPDDRRRAELVGALGVVRHRISDACAAAGRDPHSVTMIAVTKTYPVSDIRTLATLGVGDFGESRDQEARAKIAELRASGGPGEPGSTAQRRWHLVGRLQTNKARNVVGYAQAVHSVDRVELAEALADAARRAQRPTALEVFVQISLDGDPTRGGIAVDDVEALAATVGARPELALRGVMAVAPQAMPPAAAFAELARLSERVRAEHPGADAISAGMSGDLEAAVAHGATHVRIGTALLGRRTELFG